MKRRLLASILSLVMMLSLLPTAVWATDNEDEVTPEGPSENEMALLNASQQVDDTTSYVYGGCMIVFTQNTDDSSTYTATVRALTDEEASDYSVSPDDIGNLGAKASPMNGWDGNGEWASSGSRTPALYWEAYKDVTTKVVIKNGVTQLNGAAFTRFDKVTSLEWEDKPTVTTIGNNFLMCSSIDELTIPSSVTYIGGYAFGKYHNTGIAPSRVVLEDPNVDFGTSAFAYQDTANVVIEVNTDADISNLVTYAKASGYQVKNLKDYDDGTTEKISWTYSVGTLTLTGSGAMPDYAEGNAPWNAYLDKITEVSIADGITSIGANAFNGAKKLTAIQLPQSVETIGASAFASSGLTDKVRVPATVTSIGENAFKDVNATIYIYNGIWNNDDQKDLINDTNIGTTNVVHFIYGANIGGYTYPRSTNVLLGVAADGTAYVDAYNKGSVGGFDWDGGYYYSETNPESEKKTDDKSVVSPLYYKNTTTVWPHSADVSPLVKKVVIGDNVVSLSSGLFAYCTNLKEVVFKGKDITTLGSNVFMGTSVENVDIPATVSSVGSFVFGQYNGKGENPSSITLRYNGTITFAGKTNETDGDFYKTIFCSTEPQVPQNITLYAHGSTNAKDYADSVGYTFVDLDAKGGRIGDTNTYWTIQNNNTLFIYGTGTTENLAADADKPWAGVTGITAIKVAASVDTIGSYLFAGMSDVTSVTIGNGVTTINDYAFYDLTGLHSVALPTSVTTVGEYAFALSAASEDPFTLSIGNASANVAGNATDNRKATTDQPIASGNCGVGGSGSYQNNVTYTLDEDGVMTLTGSGAMGNFSWNGQYQPWAGLRDRIKKVVYSEGITSTGSGAFAYCKNVESVTLPEKSLTVIRNNTFMDAGTASFDKLTIPASVTQIESYAFGYYQENPNAKIPSITLDNPDTKLEHITVFNGDKSTNGTVTIYVHNKGNDCAVKAKAAEYGYKYIDLDVYSGGELTANNLKYELYDGVLTLTAIDPEKEATIPTQPTWAGKADEITKIVIGAGVRKIPADTFKDYTALTKIELPQTLVSIDANAFATTEENSTELTVTMPKSVTSLADSAFAGRSNVKMTSYATTAGGSFKADGVTNTVKKEFKVLLIGNSYSEDASDWTSNGTVSHSYEVYKSLLGDDVELTIGLMANGGKTLAWHASRANKNEPKYYLRLTDEDGKWSTVGTIRTIKDALAYDEWDVVSLQPYGDETTKGTAVSSGEGYEFDEEFKTLAQSIPYFLDLTENYVPHAQVYYYMHLTEHGKGNYADGLSATKSTYEQRAEMAQTVKSYAGTTYSNKKLTDVIPVGTAIQNARTTYLTKLSNADASTEVTLANDPVFGLQRDGGHLSYNVGRYIAALTFAEKIIPNVFRNQNAPDCGMRDSQSVGKLPAQYTEIARKAVAAAIETPYAVTTIDGYADDPITAIKAAVESTYDESAWASDSAFKTAVEAKIADYADAKVESVSIANGKATVNLRYGYSIATAEITYLPDAVADEWTSYIKSTNLDSTDVPGSTMKYSEVPQIQKAMADGYSAIWAATTEEAAAQALDNSKAALLEAVKNYVKFLADTVYNNGKATIIGDKSYTVSETDYNAAVSAIGSATDVSGVLGAYNTMLSKQTSKDHPTLTKTEAVAATCTEAGNSEYWTCDVCGKYFSDEDGTTKIEKDSWVIDARGHDMTKTDAKAATCTEDGNNEYYTCSRCGGVFKNEAGTQATTVVAETLEKLDHDWSNKNGICARCDAKCTETHKPGTTCEVCGKYTSRPSSSNTGSVISVPSTPNGTVTVNPSTASKGETVTITTKPSEGYELGSIEVLDKNGDSLKLKDLGNGKYSFVMPDGKVSVEVEFVKTAPTSFADVPASAYFADAVKWAVDKGVTNGLTDTMFGPNEPCTRAQIVTFLWRAAGSPEPKATTSAMTDLNPNAYYYKAVLWAIENGITDGMTETTFAPNATCTRGQSVTFLYRALGKKVESSASFTDVKSDAFYADAVNWAVTNNVTNGTSNTTFSPNADCTRAEIVTFLYRAYQGK